MSPFYFAEYFILFCLLAEFEMGSTVCILSGKGVHPVSQHCVPFFFYWLPLIVHFSGRHDCIDLAV